jgi:hypothetical protein
MLAGCGANVQDPGDPQARRVQAFSDHAAQITTRAKAAGRTHESLALQELLTEARLAQEDIEQTVPLGTPGREGALTAARDAVELTLAALEETQR